MQFLMDITNSLLFFVKISTWRMKIVKYECILACNSRHFNNFIRNNCSNYTHKCNFSWALIWYKILCDIICTLSCRGGVMVFLHPLLCWNSDILSYILHEWSSARKNETYHENQLVKLYKLVYIPFKTETHTWGPFLVSITMRKFIIIELAMIYVAEQFIRSCFLQRIT